MDFKELTTARFSCKKFSNQQLTADQLETILEAGRVAPTAKNLQEQKIYVIQSAEGLAMIDQHTPCRYGAPTVLAVGYCKDNTFVYPGGKHDSGVEDATIVATQMILQAADLGVNSCWLNFFNPEELAADMKLPENVELVMLMDLGFAADGFRPLPNHTNKKDLDETVSYI